MSASSYDGRRPEPPYRTDSDVVVDLQEQLDALTAELERLQGLLAKLQARYDARWGDLPDWFSSPQEIRRYSWWKGEERIEGFGLFPVGAPEDSVPFQAFRSLTDPRGLLQSSPAPVVMVGDSVASWRNHDGTTTWAVNGKEVPAPVVGGVPSLPPLNLSDMLEEFPRKGDRDERMQNEWARIGMRAGYALAASRLPALKTGEVVVDREYYEALVHLRVCAHKWRHGEAPSTPLLNASVGADAIHADLRAQPTPTEKETNHV